MTAQTKRAKAQRRPIYMRCEHLVRPSTGESVAAFVALTGWDRRALKDRKYHVGSEVRALLSKKRNVGFHRLTHALGTMLVDQVEGFEALDAHAALKRIQRECGAFCEESTIVIPGIGECMVKVPRSMAFDEMDEGEFAELFKQLCRWISKTYWPTLDEHQIADQAEIMAGSE